METIKDTIVYKSETLGIDLNKFGKNELKKDKVNLDKDFYVFTGSTVGVVPILGKGLYTGKVAQLGSAKAIIH